MADDTPKPELDPPPSGDPSASSGGAPFSPDEAARERVGLSDFVRRAVSAGFEAASGSKDVIVRVLAGEVRHWLDHLDLDSEIVRALSKMTVEVKAEFRFKASEDGKLVPEPVSTEAKLKKT